MSNYQSGHSAEKRASDYLQSIGFSICSLNWKIKAAEIDIIAKKAKRLYFIEVKYRRTEEQGSGLDYITKPKIKRMDRAANFWLMINSWSGETCLAALSVDANNNMELIELF